MSIDDFHREPSDAGRVECSYRLAHLPHTIAGTGHDCPGVERDKPAAWEQARSVSGVLTPAETVPDGGGNQ